MKIKFYCPLWGSEKLTFNDFAKKVKEAGYDGVEMSLPFDKGEKRSILTLLSDYELELIAQHWETVDLDFEKHKQNYKARLYNLIEARPLFINSQTGKDFYPIAFNSELIEIARSVSEETGVAVKHETHRGKFNYAAHVTHEYLRLFPELRLTLDVSHWFTVAESYLENQTRALSSAIDRVDHIHSRIGHTQGPQVADPRDVNSLEIMHVHYDIWDTIIQRATSEKRDYFTITTEFGPAPYMTYLPYSHQPISDQWEINIYMMECLKARYS